MRTEDLSGRRLWIGIPDPTLSSETQSLLRDIRPGGIVLFRRNIVSLDQVKKLTAQLMDLLGEQLVISIDHEGGLVTRFHRELTVFPGNMALGAAAFREPSMGEHLGYEQGYLSALELRDLGIHVNLAPVLDLASTGSNPGITIRSFGEAPALVEKLGLALVRGTLAGGVHPALKHFPGKGDARVDAHLDLPVIPPVDHEPHLRPFQHVMSENVNLVMTSHVIFEGIDPEKPATFSEGICQEMLRGRLEFEGAVMTDDLEMGAMQRNYGFDETIRLSAAAGHDIFCVCHDPKLQRRAHEILTEALDAGHGYWGQPEVITKRLDRLNPLPKVAEPEMKKAASVAQAIAGRAITVVRDDRSLLPIPATGASVLAMPLLRNLTQVENPLRGEEDGSALTEVLGAAVRTVALETDPSEEAISDLIAQAKDAPRLIVVLTNARFLPAQQALARRCLAEHPGTIICAIRNPFDLEVIPEGTEATAVASYGFRAAQLQALGRVLLGEHEAYGRLPITLKPIG